MDLLPSGGPPDRPRPAPTPQRELPRDALLLLRSLRDRPRDAGPWGEPAFAREVDRIRAQLAPIRDRRGLAASYGREAFRVHGTPACADAVARPRASRAAYAIRWLELGDGTRRPAWSEFVADLGLTRPRRRARYPSRMRLSQMFFTTLRDDPADAEMPSHRLLVRAGYVRQLGSGIYSLLPLGKRVNDRVEQVIREEQNAIGGQEMEMPVVHPADVWRASGRYDAIGPELGRFKDRNGRDMVLAMTHEEVVALLLADVVKSWRQLPLQVYHFQTKWRDEPRARGGLIRVREFVMKDAYSCDRDEAGLDTSYWAQHGAYVRIFERLGLDAIPVSSDVGMMGGSLAHEFMVLNPAGEDVLVLCEACGYAANRQVAVIPKPDPEPRGRCPARGDRDARHHDHRNAGRVPRASDRSGRPRPRSS